MEELLFLLLILCICNSVFCADTYDTVFKEYPDPCDVVAAQKCEYQNLICKLFTGPANDPATVCRCGAEFFGACLRQAGCEAHEEVGALTNHEIYMKVCIDMIMQYDCPSTLMCGINCASDTTIDTATTKLIPFNNYGDDYLRIRICRLKVHELQLERYSMVNAVPCKNLADFEICSRWIPPRTFVPVALPIDTTYIEIDHCNFVHSSGTSSSTGTVPICSKLTDATRMYGNKYLFPTSFDIPRTNNSICASRADCLGSFCDTRFVPPICAKKTLGQILATGKNYLSTTLT